MRQRVVDQIADAGHGTRAVTLEDDGRPTGRLKNHISSPSKVRNRCKRVDIIGQTRGAGVRQRTEHEREVQAIDRAVKVTDDIRAEGESQMERKDIREGDTVVIKRAGDVIPQVVKPILDLRPPDSKAYQLPESCPSCGEPVVKPEGEVAVYCVNAACPAQLVRRVEYFISRGAMDIEGFGVRIAAQLIRERLIRDVGDIYSLHQCRDRLLALEGFAEKKVDNLLMAIAAL